jgi:hypothetical protein
MRSTLVTLTIVALLASGCGDDSDEALTTTNAQGEEVVIESDELQNNDPVPAEEGADELENNDPVPAEQFEEDGGLENNDPIPAEEGDGGLENNDPIPAEQFEEDGP